MENYSDEKGDTFTDHLEFSIPFKELRIADSGVNAVLDRRVSMLVASVLGWSGINNCISSRF